MESSPAYQKALKMSNNKPRVSCSREVLEHIDPSVKVRVYRNLAKNCLSVQQNGIVKCHVDNVVLRDFKTIVSKKGQERVRKERVKNVHAFIEGFVVKAEEVDRGRFDFKDWQSISYNPYTTDYWIDETGRFVKCGRFADVHSCGVIAFDYLYL